MNFYPDIKKHISPSALQAWHKSRASFIRSYFKNEPTIETPAMKAGKKIHGLIEAGFLEAKHRFDQREQKLEFTLTANEDVKVMGIPDSHETEARYNTTWEGGEVAFVDYKTGKEDKWSEADLGNDLKMKTTAWLVLQANPNATQVRAIIEWIGTEWNGTELVPTNEPRAYYQYVFTRKELLEFTQVIHKTIQEVNDEYPKFLEASSEFINDEDCIEYARLDAEKKAIEEKMKPIKERIAEQLSFGGVLSHETDFGTFYFTTKKVYEYPTDLKFQTTSGVVMTLAEGEEVETAMSAVKKNYEVGHDPKTETKSLGFRSKKK